MGEQIVLKDNRTKLPTTREEYAHAIMDRLGLLPMTKKGTKKMHLLLLAFMERETLSVEEMAHCVEISTQTMYHYIKRWNALNLLKRSFRPEGDDAIITYGLNGESLTEAMMQAKAMIRRHLTETEILVRGLDGREWR